MNLFDEIFNAISQYPQEHKPDSALMALMRTASKQSAKFCFEKDMRKIDFGNFGELEFPYHQMGAISSLDLFGIDELILFSFYATNRHRYRNVVDFGANIGLHSIIMARCGFHIRSFEPDSAHLEQLKKNFLKNGVETEIHEAAVSLEAGEAEFVRVLGNTTGSHIKGAKEAPYGALETFSVRLEAAQPHLEWADLAKIDIEGHEAELLTNLPQEIWQNTDAVLEVGTLENASRIYEFFKDSQINMFAQKTGWQKVEVLKHMPTSHREGSLFISAQSEMPWS